MERLGNDSSRVVRFPRATLAATILGSSLAFIDGSVVNVALPALAHDMHAGPANLTWVINAYLLPLGALILLGGSLGDHYGRRRWFLWGLGLFLIATLMCAGAPSLFWLLAGRSLQGIGAALLMPNSLAILGSTFSGEARGRAIGTWAAVGALAGALGPVIGGWLIDTVGWRIIFVVNLPVGFGAAWLTLRYVAETAEPDRAAPLDVIGASLATLALGLLTWALTEAAASDSQRRGVWVAALAGALLMLGFLWHEYRSGDQAIVPRIVFSSQAFIGLTLLTFFLYGALGGVLVLIPYLLIKIEHWSALSAGAALLPLPLIIGGGSRFMGRVAARVGGRLPLAAGSVIVGLGIALFARIGAIGISYWTDVFPPMLLIALGMGACVAPLTTSVMAAVDTDHVGIASGFNSAIARIAGLIATALLGFVFVRENSEETFMMGFRMAAFVGACASLLAAACAIFLIGGPPERPFRQNE